jgi:hypothetical protein
LETWWVKISEEVDGRDKILLKVWVLAHVQKVYISEVFETFSS